MPTVFKALADPTRRRVLELLRTGPMSAGALAGQFDHSKPTMSAHFAVLREAGLVASERQGKNVIYRLQMSVLGSPFNVPRATARARQALKAGFAS